MREYMKMRLEKKMASRTFRISEAGEIQPSKPQASHNVVGSLSHMGNYPNASSDAFD